MKKLHIFIIAFAALSLTGCKSLYGNYKRPKAKMTGVVRHPIDDHAQLDGTNDFGNLPWRSVFTDTLLQKIIERSLDNNPNLINAILNIDIAEQQLRAAKLAFLPNVILNLQGQYLNLVTNQSLLKPIPSPLLQAGMLAFSVNSVHRRSRHRPCSCKLKIIK